MWFIDAETSQYAQARTHQFGPYRWLLRAFWVAFWYCQKHPYGEAYIYCKKERQV